MAQGPALGGPVISSLSFKDNLSRRYGERICRSRPVKAPWRRWTALRVGCRRCRPNSPVSLKSWGAR